MFGDYLRLTLIARFFSSVKLYKVIKLRKLLVIHEIYRIVFVENFSQNIAVIRSQFDMNLTLIAICLSPFLIQIS